MALEGKVSSRYFSYIHFKRTTFHFQSEWAKNVNEWNLSAIMHLENVKSVPLEVSNVLTCSCEADKPCKKTNCS